MQRDLIDAVVMTIFALRPYELSDRVGFFRLVAEEDARRKEPQDEAQVHEGFQRVLPGCSKRMGSSSSTRPRTSEAPTSSIF